MLVKLKDILFNLILTLQSLPTFYSLLSNSGNKSLFGDLLRFNLVVNFNGFDIKQFLLLLNAILCIKPNEII